MDKKNFEKKYKRKKAFYKLSKKETNDFSFLFLDQILF